MLLNSNKKQKWNGYRTLVRTPLYKCTCKKNKNKNEIPQLFFIVIVITMAKSKLLRAIHINYLIYICNKQTNSLPIEIKE